MKLKLALLAAALLMSVSSFAQQQQLGARAVRTTAAPVVRSNALVSVNAVTATTYYVHLTWTASSTPGVTYTVYRGATAGGEVSYSAGNATTVYNDTGVVSGTYFYVVTAVNAAGESGPSNEVSAIIPVLPAAPTGLTGAVVKN